MTPRYQIPCVLNITKRNVTRTRSTCLLPKRGTFSALSKGPSPTFPKPLDHRSHMFRYASTADNVSGDARSTVTRLKNLLLGTTVSLTLLFSYVYFTDTRASFHLFTPSLVEWIYDDPEDAHEAGNRLLKTLYGFGLHPRERGEDETGKLGIEVFGRTLANPIGTSAGIDKKAYIPDVLYALGPSIVEVGGATPMPQDGNPKPRVFRLPSQNALINRYGLGSEGADHMAMVLRQRVRAFAYAFGLGIDEEAEREVLDENAGVPPGSLTKGKLLAVQIAKNKSTPDDDIEAVKGDYVYCVDALAKYADILVINVSSPNTPGLRDLQRVEPLTTILTGVVKAVQRTDRKTKPAVMVKVSPDEDSDEQVQGICDAIWESGVDGGNTTKQRPAPFPVGHTLPQREAIALMEQGGYSGPQLFERTVRLVSRYRTVLDERLQSRDPEPRPSKESLEVEAPAIELQADVSAQIDATVARDKENLKSSATALESDSKSQPIFRLPERHNSDSANSLDALALSSSSHIDQLLSQPTSPPPEATPSASEPDSLPSSPSSLAPPKQKVIFATGGITNGAQALEVLEAGASVAQVYTALVYGGAGTITRMKREMRAEMQRRISGDD